MTDSASVATSEREVDCDVIIVGGGIHGCGIARDAALRGLRVILVEKGDIAQGTSSASSKLVHGGLRYLEHFRLGLVRTSLLERSTLLRIAPHLVRPLPFLVPIYDDSPRPRWLLQAGLSLYDVLAWGHSLGRHRWLSVRETLAREPTLQPRGLRGAFLYHDAQMNDARLCIENLIDAVDHGASVRTRSEARELITRDGIVHGVRVVDRRTGAMDELLGHIVVNASGPWYADLQGVDGTDRRGTLRLSRGSHVVVSPLSHGHALLLQARSDGRIFFVMPFKGMSLLGTTEVEHEGPVDGVVPSDEEIRYLLQETARALATGAPRSSDVRCAFAGLRALIPGQEEDIGAVSREARIRQELPGLIGVLGGKYTTYRSTSQKVVDLVEGRLRRRVSPCRTGLEKLPGGELPPMNDYLDVAQALLLEQYPQLAPQTLRYLLDTYGSRHVQILKIFEEDPQLALPLEPGLPFCAAEILHAVRNELAVEIEDVLWRRTWRGYVGPLDDPARAAWERAFEKALTCA